MSQDAALFRLQTLDSQIDSARERLEEITRLLSENHLVRDAQKAVEIASVLQLEWKTKSTDLELERGALRDEADAAENRLYSGKVLNPRELTDLQDKVRELRQRGSAAEESALEAMMEAEDAQINETKARANLAQVMEKVSQTSGALLNERVSLEDQIAQAERDILQTRSEISQRMLAHYDELRKRSGGVAVVKMRPGNECGACGVGMTSQQAQQVHHGEMPPCPTCGRILVS